MQKVIKLVAMMALMGVVSAAVAEVKLVESKEPGWPQWRGPRRNGISSEKGLLAAWPSGGPKLLWKKGGLGNGYCSPVVSGGTIYITGDEGDKLSIFALDLAGKQKWKVQNGKSWTKSHPGARSSCTVDGDRIYQMNAHGRVVCLNASDGSEVWSVKMLERYSSGNIIWGITEALIVLDDKVIVTTAGKAALMAALDKKTGKEIWKTAALDGEQPSYASVIAIDTGKGIQLITGGSRHAFGVDAKTGKMLWKYRHEIEKPIMLTPSYYKGRVIISNCFRYGAKYYSLALDLDKNEVTKKWLHSIGNPLGSVTCADDQVICSSSHKPKGWVCIDADSGKIKDRKDGLAYGSTVYAEGKHYGLASNGKMMLIDASAGKIKIVSEFAFQTGKKDVWAHPVICDGKLYLRYADTLYCYGVKK